MEQLTATALPPRNCSTPPCPPPHAVSPPTPTPTSTSSTSTGLNASSEPAVSSSPSSSSSPDLLFEILGPKQSPFVLPITSVYLLIFLTGLAGNLLTCTVIAKRKKMRTATNLYLVSLAASDLLLLLFAMPLELYDLWQNYPFPFGEGGCYLKTFLFETVCFASILNVTALSAERYVAVVHPLKTRYLATNRHARRVIGAVWLASMACAVPNTLLHGIFRLPGRAEESAICTVLQPLWIYNLLIQATTVCFFLLPMAVISGLYLVMALHLGRRQRRRPPARPGKSRGRSSAAAAAAAPGEGGRQQRQVTKMLAVVVAAFGVCWAPFHVERLLWSSVGQWTDAMHAVYQWVHILSGVLFYLSSAVNPLIYSLLSTRFRQGFRELVCSQAEGAAADWAVPATPPPPPPQCRPGPRGATGPPRGGQRPGLAPGPGLHPHPGSGSGFGSGSGGLDPGMPRRCRESDGVTSAC